MKPDNKVLLLIPARGGSVSIPNKNIVSLDDKPLIAWAIDACKEAIKLESLGRQYRLVVSTDDDTITNIALNMGAGVPFKRPAKISEDVPTEDVVVHTLKWLRKHDKYEPDIVVVIQCTTPLIEANDIQRCIHGLEISNVDACVSVRRAIEKPSWFFRPVKGKVEGGIDQWYPRIMPWYQKIVGYIGVRQKLPYLYVPNGGIYALWAKKFLKHKSMFGNRTAAYEMPMERSLDIDEPFDLELIRALIAWRKKNGKTTKKKRKKKT